MRMEFWIGHQLPGLVLALAERWRLSGPFGLVADNDTMTALGKDLMDALASQHQIRLIALGHAPKATRALAQEIGQTLSDSCKTILSVGSGTITDLCKYAAHHTGLGHIAFATAPSMNGYGSATASLYDHHAKHSFPARRPDVVAVDMGVLCAAPWRLIRAGFGDVMCRSTAQADWLLSHLLLDTSYDASLFDAWRQLEQELIKVAAQLPVRDESAIGLLMQVLMTSSEAMFRAGSSAPASQGEHMIAHLCESQNSPEGESASLHGEQIAISTLTMSRIQDYWLSAPAPPILSAQLYRDQNGRALSDAAQTKAVLVMAVQERLCRLGADWPEMTAQMKAVRVSTAILHESLSQAHCPLTPEEIGWSAESYAHTVATAYLSRDRFTFLDMEAALKEAAPKG